MGYSTEFKQKFISEFLEIYKEDPNTSLRIFGLNKFGQNKSCIYDWLEKYDVNHVYQYKKKTHKSYKQAKTNSSNKIVKLSNDKKAINKSINPISITYYNSTISLSDNYTKDDVITILSAIKVVEDVH